MTSRNRATLRNYFGDGKLPTRVHFGDLIDSMLNMSDEGFRKSPENGIELSTPVGHDALISFYRDQRPKAAQWAITYSGGNNALSFQPGIAAPEAKNKAAPPPPTLALDPRGRIGVATANPRFALDVAGVVASQGRRGTMPIAAPEPLLANGQWHDLSETLSGCQAFEVIAGAGKPETGRFALMHAIAMNTYNPTSGWLDFLSARKRIRCQHAYYGRRSDKLELGWEGSSGKNAAYRLRIRSSSDYGKDVRIKVFVTRLWWDETTQGGADE
jgi:hypothetical protein